MLSIEELVTLGFTKDEIKEKVIENIANYLKFNKSLDGDGWEYNDESEFIAGIHSTIEHEIKNAVNDAICKSKETLSCDILSNLRFTPTSRFGEPKGVPMTILEYMASYIERYLNEMVNERGNSEDQERDPNRWNYAKTRIEHFVTRYLQEDAKRTVEKYLSSNSDSLVSSVRSALEQATETVCSGIGITVKK